MLSRSPGLCLRGCHSPQRIAQELHEGLDGPHEARVLAVDGEPRPVEQVRDGLHDLRRLLQRLNRTSREIGRAIEEGEANLGVGFLVEDSAEVESAVVFRSPLVLVSPRPTGTRGRPVLGGGSLAVVLRGPIVHFEEGVELRRYLENARERRPRG